MNHLTSYSNYLNEGLFSFSKKSDIYTQLLNFINNSPVSAITKDYRMYTIVKIAGAGNENDPYNEEVYDEDISVKFDRYYKDYELFYSFSYDISINDVVIENMSKAEKKKLFCLVEYKYNNKRNMEKEDIIKNYLKKL
jgi:hypothetical protein